MTTSTSPAAGAPEAAPPAKKRRPSRRGGPSGTGPVGGSRSTVPSLMMGLMAIYFMLPFWWLLVAATKDNADLFSTASLWFGGHNAFVENLRLLFERDDGIYFTWVRNTVLYAGGAGVGATAVCACAGYAFAKLHFPGRRLLFAVLLGLIMVPGTALVLPTYLLMSKVGMVNTVWAVILPSLLNPFGVYLLRVYAHESVPDEMLEAARIDGASELRIFARIALPVMRPALVTVLLFSIVATWNNFFLPLVMLSDSKLYPLTVGLRTWYMSATLGNGGEGAFNLIVMGSLVAIAPLIVAFLFLQRYWRSGLTLGSVK